MNVDREDHDLLRGVASRLILGYDEQDLGLQVDEFADRLAVELGVCVPCKGTGFGFNHPDNGPLPCKMCGGSGEAHR